MTMERGTFLTQLGTYCNYRTHNYVLYNISECVLANPTLGYIEAQSVAESGSITMAAFVLPSLAV